MSRSSLRRMVAVGASTVALSVVIATPASAGSMYFSKASGTMASTSWLEVGELPATANALGNAHFGDLWVEDLGRGRASAFGTVYDVQCDEGTVPYNPGGGHGEPVEETGPCQLVGVRFIEGGSLSFTMDRKLTRATLTGTLNVGGGHSEGPVGRPPVDITWLGDGAAYTDTSRGRYTDGTGTLLLPLHLQRPQRPHRGGQPDRPDDLRRRGRRVLLRAAGQLPLGVPRTHLASSGSRSSLRTQPVASWPSIELPETAARNRREDQPARALFEVTAPLTPEEVR